jgi:hypothetical protein
MYVCNTEKDDVLKALKHMKSGMNLKEIEGLRTRNEARRFPIVLQVSMVKYRRLGKAMSQEDLSIEARRKQAKYFINPVSLSLHKKTCRCIKDNFLKAVIIKPKLTGLYFCKHCMG